jgi:4-amino-4-deoxy-L-arabinose transferase-like glycosyltransferase
VRPSKSDLLIALALAAVLAAQAGWAAETTSGTPDETTYLAAGLSIYHHGDVAPLVVDGIAPLPVLLSFAAPALAGAEDYARAIRRARAAAIALIAVPLVLVVYLSLFHAAGRAAAATGAALIAFSPNIIAHAAVAATDICFVAAALAALAALARHADRRSRGNLVLLALTLGVALAAKYSAVTLFPVVFAVLALTDRTNRGAGRVGHALGVTCGLAFVSLLIVWALHGFAMLPSKAPASFSLPAPIAGVISQALHQRGGHPGFLLGKISFVGWWYYMPVALALKSTPAELVVIAFGLFALLTDWRNASTSAPVWRVTILIFGAFALVNRLDLGVRYVLLLLPLFVFVTLERVRRMAGGRTLIVACAAIVILQAASAVAIAPHYLSYFNRFSGGPAVGYRYLADSNIDWGQDLPALRETLSQVGGRTLLFSYFGNAPFRSYGLSADVWTSAIQQDFERWDWVAISATHLDGLFVNGDPFEPFRSIPPSARAGYSILLYQTSRADVREAMAAAARRWRAAERR